MSLIAAIAVLALHVAAWVVIYRVLNAAANAAFKQQMDELALDALIAAHKAKHAAVCREFARFMPTDQEVVS